MTDNKDLTKKENTGYSIEFDIVKSDLKKVLSAHKKFALQGKNAEKSELSWINFKVSDDELILTTTDGNRALISKLKFIDNFGTTGEFNLSMVLVSKLSFVKGALNQIRIKKKDSSVEFEDIEYDSIQKLIIKPEDSHYPNVFEIIPNKQNFTVSISHKLIKDLSTLKAPLGYIDLSFNTKNNCAAVLVESNSELVTQQAILMPAQKKQD